MTYDGGLGGLNDDTYGSSFLVENLTADDVSTTEVNEQTRPSAGNLVMVMTNLKGYTNYKQLPR